MHNFRELKIWQRSRIFVKHIYKVTKRFPGDERFGLTDQLRRAAVSISSNIAEGCGRGTDKQLIHFLYIAQGSMCEVETQIILAYDLEILEEKAYNYLIQEIDELQKMNFKLIKRLEANL
jgi:four helix bundle protein